MQTRIPDGRIQTFRSIPPKWTNTKVSFSSNGGSAHYYRPSLGLATLYPLGYQKPAEFYSPQYEVPDSLQTDKTDFRTTIYWNPQIQTDSTGRAKVSFYTTDMNHDMEYVLEGITENGVPCRVTGRIKTK